MNHVRLLAFALLAACLPSPQPAQPAQPAPAAQNAPGCEHAARMLIDGYCKQQPDYLHPAIPPHVRQQLESLRHSCPAPTLTELETCVVKLETIAATQDPEADTRRAAARPKAAAHKAKREFKALIAEWLQVFDHMKIMCRSARASDSHARECERQKKDLDAVNDQLRTQLISSGFDPRDFEELGLWPSDPNPMGS